MSPELTSNLTMVKHLERLLAMIESLESTSGKLQKLVANAHSSIDLLEARLGMTSDGVPTSPDQPRHVLHCPHCGPVAAATHSPV